MEEYKNIHEEWLVDNRFVPIGNTDDFDNTFVEILYLKKEVKN